MKYYLKTFGCQMNKSDSEKVDYALRRNGYEKSLLLEESELIVINMCSVRQSAADRVFGMAPKFQELKEKNPNVKTVLTGCVVKKDEIIFRNFFDFILPIKSLKLWPSLLKKNKFFFHINQRGLSFNRRFGIDYMEDYQPLNNIVAFVPISSGCNNFCSYCVVPYTRGSLICRPHEKILKEIRQWIENGSKEIWLLGQNVNDYHSPNDDAVGFPELLEKVDKIPGKFWIRFISPNPKDFSEKLIEVMASSKKVTGYLNLPVQSGDNDILKKMNRPYTVGDYKRLVRDIRKKIPDIALSTDVIVGFPGETEKHFQNTVNLFRKIKFDMAYIAQYSERPGTQASQMTDDIPREEKEKRFKELTEVLEETALGKNKKYLNKNVEILVTEKISKKDKKFLSGRTNSYKSVRFEVSKKKDEDLKGKFVNVRIKKVFSWGLEAEFISL